MLNSLEFLTASFKALMDDSTRSFRRQPSKLGRAPAHDVLAKRLFRGSLLARLLRMIYLNAGVFVLE